MVAKQALVVLLCVSCRCEDPKKPEVPESAPPVYDAAYEVSAPLIEPAPAPVWYVVEDLSATFGFWGDKGGEWLELDSRTNAEASKRKWGVPYPWRLRLQTATSPTWDCGLFEKLHGTWRVGYCSGGTAGRVVHAERIEIYTDGKQLRVQLGESVHAVLSRGAANGTDLDSGAGGR